MSEQLSLEALGDHKPPIAQPSALFRHQQDALPRLLAGSYCLWHEMGLGKTRTVLAAYQRLAHDSIATRPLGTSGPQLLIVCPAVAKNVWRHEAALMGYQNVRILSGMKPPPQPASMEPIQVVNYDVLESWRTYLMNFVQSRPTILVLDEAHYLRHGAFGRARKRTQALRPLIWQAERIWQLTGTPLVNSGLDLFYELTFLGPRSPFMGKTEEQFGKQYCETEYNPWGRNGKGQLTFKGLRNEENFYRDVAQIAERRLKKDCLDLPEKFRNVQWLDSLPQHFRQIRGRDLMAAVEVARTALIPRKVKLTVEYLKDSLVERPVVIFGYHRAYLEDLRDQLSHQGSVGYIDGSTPQGSRQRLIEQFQQGYLLFLVAQLQAAGQAITLTRAAHAVFGELHWSAVDHRQAEDRLHRIGAERDVTYHYLLVENSIEQLVWDAVLQKGAAIDRLDKAMTIEQAVGR
jgi:SNF2 family DNA or RNA helicase